MGEYLDHIKSGGKFEIGYDSFGLPSSISIATINNTVCIPRGNEHFNHLLEYIDANNLRPDLPFSIVEYVTDKGGNLLYYISQYGPLIDSEDNPLIPIIVKGIQEGRISLQQFEEPEPPIALEINVFLGRSFQLHRGYPGPIPQISFNSSEFGLPFKSDIQLLHKVEGDYFSEYANVKKYIKNINGNVIRISVDSKAIKKVYNWAKLLLPLEKCILDQSLNIDMRLHKRKNSHGPRTAWYFDVLNLDQYIWVLALHVTNIIIDIINQQLSQLTISYLSKDELSECMFANYYSKIPEVDQCYF